jgi:hypothetical protein
MNYLITFGQIFIYLAAIGFTFWIIKLSISFYIFSVRKEAINKLNARLSILKMHLKHKIKKKCNKIESLFKNKSEIYSNLRPRLDIILNLTFSQSNEYQKLIDTLHAITIEITYYIKKNLTSINSTIDDTNTDSVATTEEEMNIEFCQKLTKYDRAHILIILDIIEATKNLKEKIVEFNELVAYEKNQKVITDIPESIEIKHYEIFTSIMNTTDKEDVDANEFETLEKQIIK